MQGVGGLSARDIKLIVEGGFNTVESVAYTYDFLEDVLKLVTDG